MSLSLEMNNMLLSGLESMIGDIVSKVVRRCGDKYNFDSSEFLSELKINDMKLEVSLSNEKVAKVAKVKCVVVKSKYPLPFSGKLVEGCCGGLRQNHGLYTQCETIVKEDSKYCNKCGPSPQFGTIEERLGVGLMEFRDSKGKGPIAFTKVMNKLKISRSEVEEEAGKLNIIINPVHFEEEKVDKKEKGRPKKAKKTIELVVDDSTDLFAALVAKANEESDSELEDSNDEKVSIAESIIDTVLEKVNVTVENNEKKAEKELEKQKKEAEKELEKQKKEAEKELEKQKKEAEKEAEKQKKEAEKQALIQKKEEEKALKEAEKQKKEEEKALKEAEKQKKAEEKSNKPAAAAKKVSSDSETEKKKSKPAAKEEEEQEDVVKRFEFEGVKYLKSKKTGIIYNMDQDVIGKWNEKTSKIDFEKADSEEEEEEYEE